jgi:DNA-binding transcriptional LysR family regulator
VRSEPLIWCAGAQVSKMKSVDVVPLVLHPEPSVTRLRVLQALEAAGRPYRIVVSSSSVAALKPSVMAGLGVSAFARYVMPYGLTGISSPLKNSALWSSCSIRRKLFLSLCRCSKLPWPLQHKNSKP